MPTPYRRPRHAAASDRRRLRAVLLPSTLLVATGAAFGGLAALPAAATGPVRTAAPVQRSVLAPTAPLRAGLVDKQLMRTLALRSSAGPMSGDASTKGPDKAHATDGALGSPRSAVSPAPAIDAAVPPATTASPAPAIDAVAPPATTATVATSPRPAPRASRDRPLPELTAARPGDGVLTSRFGKRWGRLHAGIDLAAGSGTPVRAVLPGTVLAAENEGGYGLVVRLEHADGTVSVYGHMSALLVKTGQQIKAGTQLGREGSSGHSTGPHLHFEIRVKDVPIDPLPWLKAHGVVI